MVTSVGDIDVAVVCVRIIGVGCDVIGFGNRAGVVYTAGVCCMGI